jgi:hypothetical protein
MDLQTSIFAWQQVETTTKEQCFLGDPSRDVISRAVVELTDGKLLVIK